MKRSIYWILIITLLVSILPVPLHAAEESEATEQPSTIESTSDNQESSVSENAPSENLPSENVIPDASQDTEKSSDPANDFIATPPTPPQLSATNLSISEHEGIVITQVQTRGSGNASDELIELYNNSDDEIDVTDWCLKRASAAGTSYTKMVCIVGENETKESRVLLPARSYVQAISTASARADFDLQFTAGMGDSGGRVYLFNQRDEKQDLVAWGDAIESETAPVTSLPPEGSLLQRKSISNDTYQDNDNNEADFEIATPRSSYTYGALNDGVDYCLNIDGLQGSVPEGWSRDVVSGDCSNIPINTCHGLMISEIGANTNPQFIELYNNSDSPVATHGCKLQTNRSSQQFNLPEQTVGAHNMMNVLVAETGLMLTKTTTGTVYLLASDGATELHNVSYADLDENTSWAWFGGTDWRQTYVVTPGGPNTYQQYASCETGYTRSTTTGRCNKAELASGLSPCKEGQYRSEETGRCRSIATDAASVLKPCADDQFRNPATNRCKKLASTDDVADCGEGRERNPTTNRCRNVVSSDVPAAAFAVEPIKDSATAFVGWWALGGIAVLALGYAGWEWRREVSQFLRKATVFLRPKG